MAVRWVDSETGFGLLDRRPEQPLAFSSLDDNYTKEAAAQAFVPALLHHHGGGHAGGRHDRRRRWVTKWERSRVVIKLLNSGGPGMQFLTCGGW